MPATSRRINYESIWVYDGVLGEVLFQMHNAAHRFIKEHVDSLNSQIYILTTEIAALCVHYNGFLSKVY